MSVNIKDASNATVPIASATLGADQVQQIGWAMATRQDVYAAAGNGVAVNVAALGMSNWGIQVTGVGGSPTVWDVRFEVSLDGGTTYSELFRHSSAGGDALGAVKYPPAGARYPAKHFRSRCVGTLTLNGATGLAVDIIGMP